MLFFFDLLFVKQCRKQIWIKLTVKRETMEDLLVSVIYGIVCGSFLVINFGNAELKNEHFIRIQASRLQTTYRQIANVSKVPCAVHCSQDLNCKSINFKASTRLCEMSALSGVAMTADVETELGWSLYTSEPGTVLVDLNLVKNILVKRTTLHRLVSLELVN